MCIRDRFNPVAADLYSFTCSAGNGIFPLPGYLISRQRYQQIAGILLHIFRHRIGQDIIIDNILLERQINILQLCGIIRKKIFSPRPLGDILQILLLHLSLIHI